MLIAKLGHKNESDFPSWEIHETASVIPIVIR